MVARGHVVIGGGGEGGPAQWSEIQGKPATFPATAHTHAQADVTNLGTALGAKADSAHTHAVADVTGLQVTLDGKSATGHTHAYADVTGKPATFAPSAHVHAIADTTGLGAALTAVEGAADTAMDLAADASQVWAWDTGTSAYVLVPGARIYLGPEDPGTGILWVNVDPA